MIIKQLTLQGFKSFGRKTTFSFQGGVTAIVGPNGSGKSNVADGLRWVLGEQSPKTLRVKKTDDLIFGGTAGKARGSLAEVSVLFDNSDGQFDLGFAEVEISRRLYGSGESEYKLNGRKAKLQEIQQLLAEARIGVNSYAIIGQGTIDSLILATPAERKQLFEEASGIKAFELQRVGVLKRLRSTDDNIQRARDILAELAPRLTALERNLQAVERRTELEVELKDLQAELASAEYVEFSRQQRQLESQIERAASGLLALKTEITELQKHQRLAASEQEAAKQIQATAVQNLDKLEAAREQLLNEVSVEQAELQHLNERLTQLDDMEEQLERLADQQIQLEQQQSKLSERLRTAQSEQTATLAERERLTAEVRKLQRRLVQYRDDLQAASHLEYVVHAQTVATDLHHSLQLESTDLEHLQNLVSRVRRLLKLAAEQHDAQGLEELKHIQSELMTTMRAREQIEERNTKATLQVRSLELDGGTLKKTAATLAEQRASLQAAAVQATELHKNVARREAVLATKQQRVQEHMQRISALREQLVQAAQPSVDAAVAVATELEQHLLAHRTLEQQLHTAESELRRLRGGGVPQPAAIAERLRPSDQVRTEVIQVSARLEALSELGAGVAEEYAESKERHDSLTLQLTDLQAARQNLNEITVQLDTAIRGQFESGFVEISEGFSTEFQRLFGGGSAKLELHSSDDGEVGVEIEVVPPGKRPRNLTALSGGERSLAGIALLAAIVRAHPSPFLVLDEVDAALDEANAARLKALLTELAVDSQLLVITHNRETMTAAQVLYGITMDEHHVSRMVSVKLEEAVAAAS